MFFGPADVAADIGKAGDSMCAAVWDLVLPVAYKLIEKGIPIGTLVLDPKFAKKRLAKGFFAACGSDASLLARVLMYSLPLLQTLH